MTGKIRTYKQRIQERIDTGMIVGRLHKHIAGETEMSPTQIAAARILLNKTVPDMKALEIKGNINHTNDIKSIPNDNLLRIIEGEKA